MENWKYEIRKETYVMTGFRRRMLSFYPAGKTYLGKSAYQSTAFIIPVPEKDEMGNTMWNITVEPKFKNESLRKKVQLPQKLQDHIYKKEKRK